MNWWPIVWLIIMITVCVIELCMPQRYAICCALPALICIILAACNVQYITQIVVFIVLSVSLMISCRQYIIKVAYLLKLNYKGETLIGRQFKLIYPIKFGKAGKVIVDGNIWNVVGEPEFELPENGVVEVVDIGFFRLVVKPIEME